MGHDEYEKIQEESKAIIPEIYNLIYRFLLGEEQDLDGPVAIPTDLDTRVRMQVLNERLQELFCHWAAIDRLMNHGKNKFSETDFAKAITIEMLNQYKAILAFEQKHKKE